MSATTISFLEFLESVDALLAELRTVGIYSQEDLDKRIKDVRAVRDRKTKENAGS